ILLLFIQLTKLNAIIPFDGIIHRSSDGSSYAFLSSPRIGGHASFIEQLTPSGTLAVAWFTGVLFWNNETQILHLYHTSQVAHGSENTSQIWHVQSKDRGATWSTPEPFYTLPGAYDRHRIIPSFDGNELIFLCYNSTSAPYSFILRLSLEMSIVTRTDINQSVYLIQPTVIRLNNTSKLRAFFRDKRAVWIYYADSDDDGLNWTIPKPTYLPNNDAAIVAYTLKSGAVIMSFDNHNGTQQPRSPLTVALSYDNGITWPYHRDIQIHDDDNDTYVGEYSYPSLIQSFWKGSDDNDVHLVHTYDRETIKYRRFNEKWIKQGK
ncbi:unnamed protein product, partial [Rotaria sordida]